MAKQQTALNDRNRITTGPITRARVKELQILVQRVMTNQPLEDEFDLFYHYESYLLSDHGSFCKLMRCVQNESKRIIPEEQIKDRNDQNITTHEAKREKS